jgi:hypothetical protein
MKDTSNNGFKPHPTGPERAVYPGKTTFFALFSKYFRPPPKVPENGAVSYPDNDRCNCLKDFSNFFCEKPKVFQNLDVNGTRRRKIGVASSPVLQLVTSHSTPVFIGARQ